MKVWVERGERWVMEVPRKLVVGKTVLGCVVRSTATRWVLTLTHLSASNHLHHHHHSHLLHTQHYHSHPHYHLREYCVLLFGDDPTTRVDSELKLVEEGLATVRWVGHLLTWSYFPLRYDHLDHLLITLSPSPCRDNCHDDAL